MKQEEYGGVYLTFEYDAFVTIDGYDRESVSLNRDTAINIARAILRTLKMIKMRALAIIAAMSSCTPAMANPLVDAHIGATSSLTALQAADPQLDYWADAAIGAGVGYYYGEKSLAISGKQRINDNVTLKAGVAYSDKSPAIVAVGMGVQW